MKFKDAIDFFNNYREHVNNKTKITIGYDNTIKIVEAYELLEGHIQDLTEECTRKQNLIDVQNKLIDGQIEELESQKVDPVEVCKWEDIGDIVDSLKTFLVNNETYDFLVSFEELSKIVKQLKVKE